MEPIAVIDQSGMGSAPAEVTPPAPPAPRLRRTLFGAACFSIQPVLLSAIALPATAYVIRGLGAAAYGEWAMATMVVSATLFLCNPGLRNAFVRTIGRDPAGAGLALAEQIGIRIALSVTASLVAIVAIVLLGYSHTVLLCAVVMSLGTILSSIAGAGADLLQGLERLHVVAGVNTISGIILTAGSVIAIYFGAGPLGVAGSYLLGPLVSALLFLWIIQSKHYPVRVHLRFGRAGRLLWDARHLAVQQFLGSLGQYGESLIVSRLVAPASFGFFSAGTLLATRLTAIPDGISAAAYPVLVRAHQRGGRAMIRLACRFILLMLLVCLAAALTVFFLAGPIAEILFPGRSQVCAQVMRITIWLLPIMGASWIIGYSLNAINQDAALARATFFSSALSLLAAIGLIWQWGLIGACWSMVFRYIIQFVFLLPCAVRSFKALYRQSSTVSGVVAAAEFKRSMESANG